MVWSAESGFGGVFWLHGSAAIVLRVPFWGCVLVVLCGLGGVVFRWCFCGVKSFCGRVVLWCRVVVFAVGEVLGKSGVEKCWGRVLPKCVGVRVLEQSCKSVAEIALAKCCRTYWIGAGKSGVERCCGSALQRSVEVVEKSGVENSRWERVV